MNAPDIERLAMFLRGYARSQGAPEHEADEADALVAARKLIELPCIAELVSALWQYRSDLRYPPAPDSIERRIGMIDRLIGAAA